MIIVAVPHYRHNATATPDQRESFKPLVNNCPLNYSVNRPFSAKNDLTFNFRLCPKTRGASCIFLAHKSMVMYQATYVLYISCVPERIRLVFILNTTLTKDHFWNQQLELTIPYEGRSVGKGGRGWIIPENF